MIVLAYLLISISVSSIIVGMFYIAYYCFFFCTLHLLFVLRINYISYHRWPALMGILPFLAACYV